MEKKKHLSTVYWKSDREKKAVEKAAGDIPISTYIRKKIIELLRVIK